MKSPFLLALVAGLLSVSQASFASCHDCTAKNGMIIWPNETPAEDIHLAWNYKGVAGLDYERMLKDEDYSRQVFETEGNDNTITNYLTDKDGRVLAEIPSVDAGDGIFGAAGISPNHRSAFFKYDVAQGFVTYSFSWRWGNSKMYFYRVVDRGEVETMFLNGVGLPEVQAAYEAFLDRTFGANPIYQRDKKRLTHEYDLKETSKALCGDKTEGFCFSLSAMAYVPKAFEDEFSTESTLVLSVKVTDIAQGKLEVVSITTDPERK